MKRVLQVVSWLLLSAVVAQAQISGGAITGTLHDDQGGALADTTVVLTGVDFKIESTTDATGKFRFLNLAPGEYRLVATRAGFSDFVQKGIVVGVGATADLVGTMKLASVQESVTVAAGAPPSIADTRTTGTTTNVTRQYLENIPTSRDPFTLLRSVPGVLVDRVNVGGSENGQQSNPVSKGTRPFDATWTLDGVVVTDMVNTGASPIYFNHDNFEEVEITTAGQDIVQPTGGLGVNLVVRRGTNDFHGLMRGYISGNALEASNVSSELVARGVTSETADHTEKISDWGLDLGGPLVRDRLWFYGSYSQQDVQLVRTGQVGPIQHVCGPVPAVPALDCTSIRNPNLKINWQASLRDRVSFLYFDGDRIRDGRPPTVSGVTLPTNAPTALQNQRNAYANNPFHGLWKLEDSRTFGSSLFASGKVAYFNTGFELQPTGGMDMTSGRSLLTGISYGSVNSQVNLRPQWIAAADGAAFRTTGKISHDIKFGTGWRRVTAETDTVWPGNGFLAIENSPTDHRVRIFREGHGANRVESASLYLGDTMQLTRLTVEGGVRFDHQTGAALPSSAAANPVFPNLVPGVQFPGYNLPLAWNTWSPRAGVTYALTDSRHAILRASVSRYAGQMPTAVPALLNPSTSVGFRDYRWSDVNGDHLATPDEVLLNQFVTSGGGFNAANPTAVTSPNQLASDFRSPVTTSVVTGVDYEVRTNLVAQVRYSYTRSINTIGNTLTRVGVSPSDYSPAPDVVGTLPNTGLHYDIPTFALNNAALFNSGGGVVVGNWNGYWSDYHGVELGVVKRLSAGWMAHVAVSLNDAREHYTQQGLTDAFGNPTRTDTEPLVNGGQYAPSPGNDVFLNARWQVTAEGLYMLPKQIQIATSIFGRQGYPFAPYKQVVLGLADQVRVLLTPQVDTYRMPNVWETDLRIQRPFVVDRVRISLMADIFNLFNTNTVLLRIRNVDAPNYDAIEQEMSPRILRLGATIGF
jgi:hypothetical protein